MSFDGVPSSRTSNSLPSACARPHVHARACVRVRARMSVLSWRHACVRYHLCVRGYGHACARACVPFCFCACVLL